MPIEKTVDVRERGHIIRATEEAPKKWRTSVHIRTARGKTLWQEVWKSPTASKTGDAAIKKGRGWLTTHLAKSKTRGGTR